MANSTRTGNTTSGVLAKESSMLAVAPTVLDTRKPLPKQLINNTLPEHGVNVIKNISIMATRETTIKRHRKIRKRYKELLGSDTVMNIYYRLADEFCMSVDRIRQIIAYH